MSAAEFVNAVLLMTVSEGYRIVFRSGKGVVLRKTYFDQGMDRILVELSA